MANKRLKKLFANGIFAVLLVYAIITRCEIKLYAVKLFENNKKEKKSSPSYTEGEKNVAILS